MRTTILSPLVALTLFGLGGCVPDQDQDNDGYIVKLGFNGGDDCNDQDPNINPGAKEVINSHDDDCDGLYDCDDPDTAGAPACVTTDTADSGTVDTGAPTTDTGPKTDTATPGDTGMDETGTADTGVDDTAATETGAADTSTADSGSEEIDTGDTGTVVTPPVDADGDGFSPSPVDCDDTNPDIYPGAPEICNDVDDNCDGVPDNGLPLSTFFLDVDGDGYGNHLDGAATDCAAPAGYVSDDTDCDNDDADVNPGATEIAGNGIDEDCDGVDDPAPITPCAAGTSRLSGIYFAPVGATDLQIGGELLDSGGVAVEFWSFFTDGVDGWTVTVDEVADTIEFASEECHSDDYDWFLTAQFKLGGVTKWSCMGAVAPYTANGTWDIMLDDVEADSACVDNGIGGSELLVSLP